MFNFALWGSVVLQKTSNKVMRIGIKGAVLKDELVNSHSATVMSVRLSFY